MANRSYEDLLEPRRNDFNIWLWSTRALNTQVAVKMRPRPNPDDHKLAVLNSLKISEIIEQIGAKSNMDRKAIERQLMLILDEVGYTKSLKVIRYLSYILSKLLLKVCSGVYVNYQGLLKIKSTMGNCPVIFVPSHRSYADFVIFSYVFFHYGIEIPAIAAGMDFQGMMGVGEMLRNTGAFFMRRSYGDDSLYWAAFKEYVHQLVCKGDLPVEFFIEGTRSRSNKSMVPKYGLINMILKSYFLSQVPDILFVPVSVNYDRLIEENLFSFELLGIPKPRESTSGFFRSWKLVKESFGSIYFHFGDPISTREFFEDKFDRSKHSLGPIHLHEINEEEKRLIPHLAYEIVRRQQISSVVSYFNLIALILNNNITRGQEFTGMEELAQEIRILRGTFRCWGATIFEQDIHSAIKDSLKVHQNLITVGENGKIGLVTNQISMGAVDARKLKGHSLSEATISYSVPFMMLQIYANPVLHYFIDGALIVVALRSTGRLNEDDLFKHFRNLRAIFSFEFVLLETWYKTYFEEALHRLSSQKIIARRNEQYEIFENNYFEEVLISSIQPFILSYYVVAEILQTLPEVVEEKLVLASAQKLLEEAISERKIFIHPYAMSLDTLGNCLSTLVRMGAAVKRRREGRVMLSINRESIGGLKSDLETYLPSFQVIKSFDIFVHIKSKL
ncbi:dihydroxyacetone phosphate acyltransferase [Dendroctonus ponderosae]|uniref:dihydroxyacetone phosphate acyltransferase n=1 Tax=Dendroctonus ponderosae TaxID=77166 RepID=UPI0020360DE9|nr:dihydroxyacetone phosphate acyltransferase [Dendroctonus ponderosae]KAH1015612.1 hypothetical protein HUJ05_013305 [Dendroctonus ponderosae]